MADLGLASDIGRASSSGDDLVRVIVRRTGADVPSGGPTSRPEAATSARGRAVRRGAPSRRPGWRRRMWRYGCRAEQRSARNKREQSEVAKLVIVESPAKARTIGGYLGKDYVVESSIGHIRDLPNNAADTPAKIKDKPWGRLAVDVDNGFEPYYVVPRDKKSHITKLKKLVKDADALYLATDEDREGEAIAWHLLDELKPPKGLPVHRMVFHEITKAAILAAVENPREINDDLVEAQETRRILDRLYGYEVSPVLWKKVMSGLSAGRVQSVATRLVVDKERERMKFRVASYWDIDATFDAGSGHDPRMFPAKLYSVDGVRVARGSDFDNTGVPKGKGERVHLARADAEALAAGLADTTYDVRSVESKPYRRSPYAPFRTTTLQQEASRKLGMSASVTMSVAQRLYENGFITYMRTDSTTLSGGAVGAARDQVRELYGAEYLPDSPRTYASQGQERPGGARGDPARRRLVPHARRDRAVGRAVPALRADLDAHRRLADEGRRRQLGHDPHRRCRHRRPGRRVQRERSHDHLPRLPQGLRRGHRRRVQAPDDAETRLPELTQGDAVSAARLTPEGHETKPPARYTEATLIKELEDREIGRPSTYASIIGTILNRGYVYKKGTALVPAWLAFSVVRLLEEHFPRQVSYEFTASMEDVLDEIAGGRKDRATELGEFYYGEGDVVGPQDARHRPRRDRRQGDRDLPDRHAEDDQPARRPLRPVRRGPPPEDGDGEPVAGQRARRPAAGRADRRQGQGAARQPGRRRAGRRQPPRHRPADRREERPLRPLRHRAAARRRAQERQAAHRLALLVDDPRHGHPRAGGQAARPAARRRHRRGRHRDHRAERPLRALPEEGHRLALADSEDQIFDITLDQARRSTPSPSSAAAPRPTRR